MGVFRKVLQSMTLSDGTFLPAGTYIGSNIQNSVFDNSTLENPYEFDAFRFARLRSLPGQEQMFQSVQTSADHLFYGYGNQACPGRFFAAHEAKVVIRKLLMDYDFRFKKAPTQHPLSHVQGILTEVDPNVEFEFKRRA